MTAVSELHRGVLVKNAQTEILKGTGYALRAARPYDVAVILDLREKNAQWLQGIGSDQWAQPVTPRKVSKFESDIKNGNTWIAVDGNEPIASISLSSSGDGRLWTPAELEEPALYASSLLVVPEHKGNQIGAKLLDWAQEKAHAEGKKWVRLDCWTTNSKLHEYYTEQGFSHVRTILDRKSGALFQRSTA
ncbi:MAG: GNAT family N-acetyltransferase [Candidatus Levybacteria bacterium]|nr:GNAT family N-acetyltransferase [Candidatus Levybacteria bacterium]